MGRCNKCNEESTDLLCVECAAWWNVEDYDDKVRELSAENARLRRQVERLVGLVSEAWYSGGTMPYCESGIKQRADAILADEQENP